MTRNQALAEAALLSISGPTQYVYQADPEGEGALFTFIGVANYTITSVRRPDDEFLVARFINGLAVAVQ